MLVFKDAKPPRFVPAEPEPTASFAGYSGTFGDLETADEDFVYGDRNRDRGRSGHAESDDKVLAVDLAVPKAIGGGGAAGTNPEQLFAAGYAACFGSALDYLAKQRGIDTGEVSVTAEIGIGPNDHGSFSLSAALAVAVPHLSQADAEALVADAHKVCPYSNAVKGNVDVALTAQGGR